MLAEIAAALAEPNRLRLLGMLVRGERCLGDLVSGIELVSSTVSNHMAVLRRAGLVQVRKDGRWMHFRLADRDDASPESTGLRWAIGHLPERDKLPPEEGAGHCSV